MSEFTFYKNFVLGLRKNLEAENFDAFNSMHERINSKLEFVPENRKEFVVFEFVKLLLTILGVFCAIIVFWPLIPFFEKTFPTSNLLLFLVGILWFMSNLISLMVFFVGFFLAYFSSLYIYFSNFLHGKKFPIFFAFKFAWFYLHASFLVVLKTVVSFNFLKYVFYGVVLNLVVTLVVNFVITFLSVMPKFFKF
ncbi:MAG: hypothetical protein Q7K42_01250 [Candidatus Diapherotrites archaeon]|nr:hypothetical protein [Candidatus Diapherotrites archaeon]